MFHLKLISTLAISALILLLNSCGPAVGVKEDKKVIEETEVFKPVIIEENIDQNREMIDGFRVKVDSRTSIEDAQLLEKEISAKVDEPIYTEFIVDQYMVYVGDCQTKEEGEELKSQLKMEGFSKSYLVPKKVFKKNSGTNLTTKSVPEEYAEAVEKTNELLTEKDRFIGFRVQVFAGASKENAEKLHKELAATESSNRVYLVVADNMYKVQIGDFKSRPQAETSRDALRQNSRFNLSGAFVVESIVYKAKAGIDNVGENHFFIQIGAFSSNGGAQQIKQTAEQLGYKAIILEEESLYKVMVGGYPDRSAAEAAKADLSSKGFDGSWIVEK